MGNFDIPHFSCTEEMRIIHRAQRSRLHRHIWSNLRYFSLRVRVLAHIFRCRLLTNHRICDYIYIRLRVLEREIGERKIRACGSLQGLWLGGVLSLRWLEISSNFCNFRFCVDCLVMNLKTLFMIVRNFTVYFIVFKQS